MSKYQALKESLKALAAICKWNAEEHDIWEGGEPFDSLVGSAEDANVAAYIAEANPSTIRALLADLERAEKALREVVAVFDSNPSSIVDTVWVTGNRPETLYDHCQDALRTVQVPMTWQGLRDCQDGDVWFALSCGHVVMGYKSGQFVDWESDADCYCCHDAIALKAQPVQVPAHHGIAAKEAEKP